jgi:PhoH-like ATPase
VSSLKISFISSFRPFVIAIRTLPRPLPNETPPLKEIFKDDTPDHRILGSALEVQKKEKNRTVILVTKDVNLRMKAKAIGVPAEDYTTDRISNVEELYSGKETIENFDDSILLKLYQPPYEVPFKDVQKKLKGEVLPNKFYILRNENRSVLAHLDQQKEVLRKVDKFDIYGIKSRNAEQTFAADALTNNNIPLVSLTGKAGTGKTLLAIASALHVRKSYRQIYIARPVVPLSNKDIGYLPGDIDDKLAPYMQPLWDNIKIIQDQYTETDKQHQTITQMMKDNKLVIEPLTYIRGRSLQRIFSL